MDTASPAAQPAKKSTKKDKFADMVVRAITIPVWGIESHDRSEVNKQLSDNFRLATDLANWCVHRLYAIDTPNVAKCPDAVRKWANTGYADAMAHYPDADKWAGAMQSFGSIIRRVAREYIRRRFDVMVRHDQKCLTFRYPYPFEFTGQQWSQKTSTSLSADKHGRNTIPHVLLPVPGMGRVDFRLANGKEFARQLKQFTELHECPERRGSAALRRDRKGQLLLTMVGYFHRQPVVDRIHTCLIATQPDCLLTVEVNGRKINIVNGDHIRNWVNAYHSRMGRTSQDMKREVRQDRKARSNLLKKRESWKIKHDDRIKTAVSQIASQVVRFCQSQKVGVVVYDDANHEYMPDGFCWYAMKSQIVMKLDEVGIEVIADDTTKGE